MKIVILAVYLVNYSVLPNTMKMMYVKEFRSENFVAADAACKIAGAKAVAGQDDYAFTCTDVTP
jgi:hypothetical protein